MRCNECNIDLGENYTQCPLCHSKAVNEEPHLKGIKVALYPKDVPEKEYVKADRPKYGLSLERIKAYFNL